jgi:hypothetical protein
MIQGPETGVYVYSRVFSLFIPVPCLITQIHALYATRKITIDNTIPQRNRFENEVPRFGLPPLGPFAK